ncbi:hypothetical protein K402DRAFT_244007 [Aulographum hederae CBS 113979]|uniref:Secreted protein n=1 Tax=Aulographum hederae CBS 113979 TaxID=1176131 RepID=A0A6G1HA91_9PEZI|nr:hypothetical protein K402DRAFT_244007 [Aulographum hederae CBS 113979]
MAMAMAMSAILWLVKETWLRQAAERRLRCGQKPEAERWWSLFKMQQSINTKNYRQRARNTSTSATTMTRQQSQVKAKAIKPSTQSRDMRAT